MKKDSASLEIKKHLLLSQKCLLFFFSLFFLLFLPCCVSVEKSALKRKIVSEKEYDIIPQRDEKMYAQRIVSEIEADIQILKDRSLNDYLNEIGLRIASQKHIRHLAKEWAWSFKIIDSSDVNAFAALGGQIYVYRGIIEATESESELAGILAFEIGHIMAHNIHQILFEKWQSQADFTPGQTISGELGWERLYQIFKSSGGVLAFFSSLQYSPSQVEKADEFALSNSYEAGFNPQSFETLVSRLAKKEKPYDPWIRKNPWSQKRGEKIFTSLKLLPPFTFPEESARFNRFKLHIKSFPSLQKREERPGISEVERIQRISVLGNVSWTDSGLDVKKGQELFFEASGEISLQKGNPLAFCGPDGYNLKTLQQPLSNKNIGALIGKVAQLISVEIDEETGEEIRNEIVEMFYVGSENRVRMPINGRLFLGINENVVGDNSGGYRVLIYSF